MKKIITTSAKSLKCGFTLAEILITLSIIGVVAALTVPAVVSSAADRALIAAAKKAYNTMQKSYLQLSNEDPGALTRVDTRSSNLLKELAPYLNVAETCFETVGCFPDVHYGSKAGWDAGNYSTNTDSHKLRLADGMSLSSDSLFHVTIDVNGSDGPNVYGKDLLNFTFHHEGSKVIPFSDNLNDCTQTGGAGACGYCMVFKNSMECDVSDNDSLPDPCDYSPCF